MTWLEPVMKLIVPPGPVMPLAEAKKHIRVDHEDDDDAIAAMLAAATAYFDGWTGILGRALESQTWELTLDHFPAGEIRLPLGPVVSVVSVGYVDPLGAVQVAPADLYEVDARATDGWVVPTAAWPATMGTINAVKVRWVAGDGCPAAIIHAIKLLLGHYYASREAAGEAVKELPLGVASLVANYA